VIAVSLESGVPIHHRPFMDLPVYKRLVKDGDDWIIKSVSKRHYIENMKSIENMPTGLFNRLITFLNEKYATAEGDKNDNDINFDDPDDFDSQF